MVERVEILNKMEMFKEKQVIKVITGIRRCGKSTVMGQFQQRLLASGVKMEQIISINLESLKNEALLNYRALYDYVMEHKFSGDGFTYVFLDEVQRVKEFQKAVDSLFIESGFDIYVTGSNSDLLSSELSTLLTGRFIEIKMLPLSFAEFVGGVSEKEKNVGDSGSGFQVDLKRCFNEYMKYGSMPYTLKLSDDFEAVEIYLEGIYNTIINTGILLRHKEVELGLMESICKFIASNVGSLISSTNIANALTSSGRKVSYATVEKYISYLKECYLIYEAKRFDIKGKQLLKSLSKYYVVDCGLRNFLLSNQGGDLGHILENIVYLQLLRQGFKVSVGKMNDTEVDFVAETKSGLIYFQVCASVMEKSILDRELAPLMKIADNYPKYLITLDDYVFGDFSGIKVINALDFLLAK